MTKTKKFDRIICKKVSKGFIKKLVNKYVNDSIYYPEELGNFYTVEDDKYVVCFNDGGDCFMEEYTVEDDCLIIPLKTKVGKIGLDLNEENRIKLIDSDNEYVGYIYDTDTRNNLRQIVSVFKRIEDENDLVDALEELGFVDSGDIKITSKEEYGRNDFVNRIGNIYIEIED